MLYPILVKIADGLKALYDKPPKVGLLAEELLKKTVNTDFIEQTS